MSVVITNFQQGFASQTLSGDVDFFLRGVVEAALFIRVFRWGCWGFDARDCRVSYRGYSAPSGTAYSLGFRLAL